jgi:hypothetical protein
MTKPLNPHAVAAVARGAAVLDAELPDWRSRIDTASLQMHHYSRCVLGQLFAGYTAGRNLLGYTSNRAAATDGFEVHHDTEAAYEYEELQAAWEAIL